MPPACWREAYRDILPADTLATLTGDLDARTQRCSAVLRGTPRVTWVAAAGPSIVGFSSVGPARDEDLAHLPELFALYVRESE